MIRDFLSRKTLALAGILALGIGCASLVHTAYAANQTGHGTSDNSGRGAGGGGPGNQGSNDNGKGNSCCNF